jgi:phage terminase small subunit
MSASLELRTQHQPQPLTIPADFGGLTLKQSAFCDHYVLTGNATDATIKAGYTLDRDSAAQIGSRLLRNVKIQAELKRRFGISVASSSEVLETLTKHARADLTDVLDSNGNLSWSKAKAKRLLKKLKTKRTVRRTKDGEEIEDITHEYEIHDPQAALEKLGRFHKLFTDKVETESLLSDTDISRLGSSLLTAMMEASARMRAQGEVQQGGPVDQQAAQPALLSPVSVDQNTA